MRRAHFAAWAPVCPVCRQGARLGLSEGAVERRDVVVSGVLVCGNPACRHEFPVIDGIPIILPDLRRHLGERAIELLLREDVDPAIMSLLGDAIGPDSWFDVIRQGVSTYGWDAYADLDPAEAIGDIAPGAARRCLARLLALAAPFDVRSATRLLDLGCAAGRTSFDLAAAAPGGLVLGIDTNLSLLRLASGVALTGTVSYGRRRIGLVYDHRRFAADPPGRERVDFWACDAAALPFAPGQADLVLALNLLDCVAEPVALLAALAAALRPGGALLLATPFDWSTRATQPASWIGGHSQRGEGGGAAEPLLAALLTPGAHPRSLADMRLTGTGDMAWHTRLHDRSAVQYWSYLVSAQSKKAVLF
jgi:SAM-dependent methyltransferase/uncharacterized protein YbaR (Trm112 family)